MANLENLQKATKPREACGIVGVYLPEDHPAANTTFYALFALQHRGQESAGIASTDGEEIYFKGEMGLVGQVFRDQDIAALRGFAAIGHTRYSTCGSSKQINVQPFVVDSPTMGKMAFGHNGNLINASALRESLNTQWGISADTSSDSEIIAKMYANAPYDNWEARSNYCMARLRGAYSLVMLTRDELVAVRDPYGIRPLCLGKLGDGWVVASETAALDNIGATFEREIGVGETLVIGKDGLKSYTSPLARKSNEALCSFEYIYFARPDSVLNGQLAYNTRMRMGALLAREHPVEADLVIGVPDSATAAGIGYANEAGIQFGEGLVRNRYVGRTFITPEKYIRDLGVRTKFNAMEGIIAGKRIVVVDDSIVRGTTTPHVVRMLRSAKAKEVHIRISSPPIRGTCHFGVDMAATRELIAANHTIDEIRQKLDADSIGYLSFEGLMEAIGSDGTGKGLCSGCFTRRYPIDVQLDMDKLELEQSQKGVELESRSSVASGLF